MLLSKVSTRRPVAMSCLIILMLIFGSMAYFKMGKDNMPNIEVPYVSIVTLVPGSSPTEIEVNVARKLEDAVSGIDGLKKVNSTCMDNVCMTLLEFQLNVDVDVAAVDVREKVDLILNDLPDEAEKPQIKKFDPNSKAVATMMATGDLPIDEIYDYIDDKISARFSTLPGVAEVEISGCDEMEFQVILDSEKMAGFGLNAYEIVNKIGKANVKVPAGRIKEGDQELTVTFDSEIKNPADAGMIEVGKFNGSRIYLHNVARIEMRSKENRTAAFHNGTPAVSIKIIKKGEANALAVVEAARKVYDEIATDGTLPGGIKLNWFLDDGAYIVSNVDDAWSSVILGMAMTALILLFFLQNVRSTFIVAVTMPASIVITFAIIKLLGYTFNNMTLLAIGTSVGTLVANSIVVLENIFKRIAAGNDIVKAADEGTAEVAAPVFASAATNVVVFLPIALMSSLVGRFFTSFAVTMTVATLVSLFISFTLTPIMTICMVRPQTEKKPKRVLFFSAFADRFNRLYDLTEKFYMRGIENVIRRPWRTVLYSVLLFAATMVFIAPHVGGSFFPETDRGELIVKLEYPSYYNLAATVSRTQALEKEILATKNVLSTAVSVGKVRGSIGQASEGVHLAEIHIKLNGKKERGESIEDMRQIFRDLLMQQRDLLVTVNMPTTVGGASAMIEAEISGDNLNTLDDTVIRLRDAMTQQKKNGAPTILDLDTSARAPRAELRICPERPVLQDLNIDATSVGMMIRSNIEGLKIGTYKRGDRTFDIRVKQEDRPGREQIPEFVFAADHGRPLQLKNLSHVENHDLPIQVNRADKLRIAKLYGNPAPGMALSELVNSIESEASPLLPPGYKIQFTGQVEKMNEASGEFVVALILASIMTYLLIAATMESWTMPFIIIFTLPLALIGMLTALWLSHLTLSMMGLLGAVMLIGIIVNNAILIMEEVSVQRKRNATAQDAVRIACREKLRPIVMTSIAAVIGIIPMAFGSGLGSELRQSAGMGIVGGLVSSTLLSIYVIPALYLLFSMSSRNKMS
ncbi:MAG: efflux RND transporter permease subunit [Victivallaceae bacterium]|nr:efflux RND transporter permease subunit [Victivallaceae bacterium]